MIQNLAKKLQVPLMVLGLILVLLTSLVCLFHLIFNHRIYPGVKVANLHLGGQSQTQATKTLKQAALKLPKVTTLKYEDQTWQLPLTNLDFAYQPAATSKKAYVFGRSGRLKKDLKEKLSAVKGEVNLDFEYQLNQQVLTSKIASLAAQVDQPPISPSIQVIKESGGSRVEIQPGQQGKKLKQANLANLINNRLANLQTPKLNLPVENLHSQITQQQAEQTQKRAEKLLGKTLTLSYQDNSWHLGDTELISYLDFEQDYEEEKIASYTAQLAESIDRAPQNALFNFIAESGDQAKGRVVKFRPAQDGQTLNQKQTAAVINRGLRELEKGSQAEVKINLPVKATPPTITTQAVNNLGIKELIGQGESYFRGSISSRVHNIQLASSQVNGLLVEPEEVFSLNEALGDVSVQTGYKQAWVIKQGKTVLGDGGGVCQVSTTLFRAVLDAGLPVIERQAHAYRVAYYEQNYQVGVDATVFAPSPDFKFKNDTPGHILIQTDVDPQNMQAVYRLYGTDDGRQITISPTRIWDQAPPPPALYQDDPTLPVGVVKQIDWAAWGAKTAFDWKVVRDGQILQKRTFYSRYQPWQAVYLRGTAGQ